MHYALIAFALFAGSGCVSTRDRDSDLDVGCEHCWYRPLGKPHYVWACHETLRTPVENGGCLTHEGNK